MRKFYSFCFVLLISFVANAQTTLVNSNFEAGDLTAWSLANHTSNQWFIGNVTASSGSQSAYVTNDGGVTNSYNLSTTAVSHIYTPVTFPAGEGAIILSFDWRNVGEHTTSIYDYIRVSLTSAAPTANTLPATADQLPMVFSASDGFKRAWVVIPASYAGQTRNLVFSWRNDGSGGTNTPGPAIDNILLTSVAQSPLSGSKTIQAGGSYNNFSEAIANLNAHGVGAGGVTFNVASGLSFNETPSQIIASGSASNPIIFRKSGVGANPLITASASGNSGIPSTGSPSGNGDAVIVISGGDYITFDGIDVASADYTTGTSIVEYGYKIINASATDGAMFNTIQNAKIVLNRTNTNSVGLYQASSTTGGGATATSAAGANSNNKYYNLIVENAYGGVYLNGGSATNVDSDNEIGTTGGGATIIGAAYTGNPTGDIGGTSTSVAGIQTSNQNNLKISNVIVRNVAASTTTRGIYSTANQGVARIFNNKVYGVRITSTSSTSSVIGIEVTLPTTTGNTHQANVYNNFISEITSAYTGSASSTRQIKGILQGSGAATSVYNIDYNSVSIDGSGSPTISSVSFEYGGTTAINNVRNNIFANFTGAQTGVAKHYAVRSTSATAIGAASSVINNNDLYIANYTNGFVGAANTTDKLSVADWTASFTSNTNVDANSINVDPVFNSTTDLHINPLSSGVDGKGMVLSVTTDIDGQARNATSPDIGADEYTAIAGIDLGISALVAPGTTGCYPASQTITVTLTNYGTLTHNFVTNPATVSANVTGAVTYSNSVVVNTGTLAPGASIDVNLPLPLNMSTAGTYTINSTVSVTGDILPANNDLNPSQVRTVTPTVSIPQSVDFTGFTGSNLNAVFPNWYEASGATVPAGTTSGWLSSTVIAGAGTTAKINLDAASDRVWIVGPKFTPSANTELKFDLAITEDGGTDPDADGITGTDDQFIIKISTDCGFTFTDLRVYDASNAGSISNTLTSQSISLGAYAGQSVIIAFFATEGTVNDAADYDLHLDNINIVNVFATDVGATALISPQMYGCYSATQAVSVEIKNYGTSAVDFSVNPVTVTTNVTGATTATLTGTLSTGVLAPGATAVVNMSTTLDMTAVGTYTFNASTSMAADMQAINDAMPSTSRTLNPVISLPQTVDFTGFAGSNLNNLFPNWYESNATPVPAGTTSAWTSSTNIPGSGTTAKINLFLDTKNDWIVGPKILASAGTQLRFKVALTDYNNGNVVEDGGMQATDDKVMVKVSTDCGLTFTTLYTYDASTTTSISNSLVQQTFSLAAYAGQNIIIAFHATDGPVNDLPDYDFHIDDINIVNVPPIDMSAISLAAPTVKECYSNAETVTVQVRNEGSAPIDFATTPLTVTTNVSGATTSTLTGTVNTGSVAVGATVDVTMSATLDMSALGIYTFNASASVAGDGNTANDALATAVTRTAAIVSGTVTPSVNSYCIVGGIPTLTLAGNSGGNIQWQESTTSATGPWANVGTNTAVYTPSSAINATTYYQAVISCGVNSVVSNVVTVTVNNPQITTTTPGEVCVAGIVNLQATASAGATPVWYDAPTNGTVVGTGTSFNTPNISSTTIYYVAASTSSSYGVGPNSPTAVGTSSTSSVDWDMQFDVIGSPATINTVDIFPTATVGANGSVKITTNTGTVIADVPFTTTVTGGNRQTITLNVTVPVGTGYKMRQGTAVSMHRNTAGASYPYSSPNVVITGNGFDPDYYYYYFNWTYTSGCVGNRTAVTATVKPATFITTQPQTQDICEGGNVTLSVVSQGANLSYQWRKAGVNISGATSANYTISGVTPADASTYDVIVTGDCGTETSSAATLTIGAATAISAQPAGQTLCEGQNVSFAVTATGAGTLTYQWKKNGVDIAGATSATYNINGISTADAATYTVSVTGTCGTVVSAGAALTVNIGTSITTQPATQGACVGTAVTFTVVANGSGTLSYQWMKNGVDIAGATSASYTITSVTAGDAGTYTVDVTGACGTVTSAGAVLSTNAITTINTQPSNQSACLGTSATFTVDATGSSLTYQWRKNGVNIAGATSSSYTIAAVASTDAGTYDVVIASSCSAAATSASATLTVDMPVAITTQPQATSACVGGNASFSVTATGAGLTYQWRKNGVNISGATTSIYTITGVALTDAANYDVVITGTCSAVTSSAVTLTVNVAPAITTQPSAVVTCSGTNASFSVTATGAALTYQWRRNGTNIAGATSATYSITGATAANAGNYDVVIGSACGSITSNVASLTINTAPSITVQPQSQTICLGSNVTLNVTATGTGLTYQWRKNGTNISGATASTLTLSSITAGDIGNYDVVVSGTCTPAASSAAAALTLAASNSWLGTVSTNWNDAANWCGGVPTATTDVTIPAGTTFTATINATSEARNITIANGATVNVTGTLNLYGNLVNNGTMASTAGTIAFRGATNQTVAAISAANVLMNGTGGVTLGGNMNISNTLTLTNGNITLGNFNLVMANGANGSATSHLVTNGTGTVTVNNVGATAVTIPVGATATSYNPVTIAAGGGRSFTIGVATGINPAILNSAVAINRTWTITPSAASATPATITFQYADADANASVNATANMEVGLYNNGWTVTSPVGGIIPSGNATARTVTTQTSQFGSFVIANLGGVLPAYGRDVTSVVLMPNVIKGRSVMRIITREAVKVDWVVMDDLGRVVKRFTTSLMPGQNDIPFNASGVANGKYFIRGYTAAGRTELVEFIKL